MRRTGLQRRVAISRGSAPQGVSAKRKSQRVAYLQFKMNLLARATYRCEHCRIGGVPLDVHHCAKPRARYLTSFDHCVVLCRACHNLVEGTYKAGRLVITPLGRQHFAYELVRAADKFAARAASPLFLDASSTGGVGNELHTDILGISGGQGVE